VAATAHARMGSAGLSIGSTVLTDGLADFFYFLID
jgi:hypothetical protein